MKQHTFVQIAFLMLRVVAGLLLMQAGALKLFGWFGGFPEQMGGAPPPFMSQIWIGAVLEFVGGFSIMIGLLSRPMGFLLSGEMAVAYFQFHQPGGFWPVQNHGEPAVLLCFIFFFIFAFGGGNYSVDAVLRKKVGGVTKWF